MIPSHLVKELLDFMIFPLGEQMHAGIGHSSKAFLAMEISEVNLSTSDLWYISDSVNCFLRASFSARSFLISAAAAVAEMESSDEALATVAKAELGRGGGDPALELVGIEEIGAR